MIYYSTYQLTPLKELNSKSGVKPREGMFIKVEEEGKTGYADYFPHPELGDKPVAQILSGKRDEYFEKCLWFAQNESELRGQELKSFRNHKLVRAGEALEGAVCKVKVMGVEDFTHLRKDLAKDTRLRLDANGKVSFTQWQTFLGELSDEELAKIDYIEDPGEEDWSALQVPSACDFMESENCDFEIYKANATRFPDYPNSIFSSYMGSDLGRYQCYLELLMRGDLSLVHGIDTPGIYQEQKTLFVLGDSGLVVDQAVVEEIYADLEKREWKCLS